MKPTLHKLIAIVVILTMASAIKAQRIKNVGYNLSYFSRNYYDIPFIDLDLDTARQVVVDKEEQQYLGHPTTVLLEDDKTLLCVYPKGHGKGGILLKKSTDAGLTWSDRLAVPASWESSLEVPTIFELEDAAGKKRLILFSGLYPARMSISEDNGENWSELKALGDWGGIVVMGDVIALNSGKGHYMAMFHDDQRFFTRQGRPLNEQENTKQGLQKFTLYKTFTYDGGLSWSEPEAVFSNRVIHLCEPGFVRAPDGKQIAVLLRENARRMNSYIIFSEDEGKIGLLPENCPML